MSVECCRLVGLDFTGTIAKRAESSCSYSNLILCSLFKLIFSGGLNSLLAISLCSQTILKLLSLTCCVVLVLSLGESLVGWETCRWDEPDAVHGFPTLGTYTTFLVASILTGFTISASSLGTLGCSGFLGCQLASSALLTIKMLPCFFISLWDLSVSSLSLRRICGPEALVEDCPCLSACWSG